ncbi:S10 family peptidase [Prauserella endophytica]|uniref:Peptidase S10 n=1 Tax=Prauserella endophytica TaxID=1592324 RepID=A0ABY2RVA8_9PSEU|nr:peptidase S10 [Prauserella endophytica]PXY26527.1 peptidase S10 [Prauserella coralliicola]TKG61988.1 peptidase S10 [Prauserella endophytica]
MPEKTTNGETEHPANGDGAKAEPAEPTDDLVTTRHSLTVKRRKLAYTAQTGRIVLRKEILTDGKFEGHKPKAEVFVTAYTLDGADPATRPVTFAFNGGPGSSSIWLHLGVLGPRRIVSGDVNDPEPPPYRLADNPDTLLAHSDLVFIDPVSTGYSRAAAGEKPKDYHGFTPDVESVGEVIRLWTSRNERWLSPKFVAGESYGTLRAAALATHLQDRHGLYLNGLLLISSVLDMGTIVFSEGNDLPYSLYLPTYAAIAHYHGKHGDRPLDDVLAEAEEFASRDLPWALQRGARLTEEERADAVSRLAYLAGLSESYVDRVNLRIEHVRFFTELLRDQGLTTGRMDGRFTTWEPDGGREHMSDDASVSRIIGAYSAGFNHYVRAELGYSNDLPYEILSLDVNRAWSYSDFEGRPVSVVDGLGAAMRANPHLKVHVALGHYDGATPYYAAEHVLARLQIPEELRDNVETVYYPAGHMMYVHEPSRVQQSKDLAKFVKSAANR